MKKAPVLFAMLAAAGVSAHSLAPSHGLGFGLEFGKSFAGYLREGSAVYPRSGSLGLSAGSFHFFSRERTAGIFVHSLLAVPVIDGAGNNFAGHDFRFQGGSVVGPAFRRFFSESLTLYYGVGLSLMSTVLRYSEHVPRLGRVDYVETRVDMGIAGDAGVRRAMAGNFFLGAGSVFALDLLRFTAVETSLGQSSSGREQLFRMLSIRPYIRAGFYFGGSSSAAQ